nr:hypothetical protein CFP56_22464 [Quercus suber]
MSSAPTGNSHSVLMIHRERRESGAHEGMFSLKSAFTIHIEQPALLGQTPQTPQVAAAAAERAETHVGDDPEVRLVRGRREAGLGGVPGEHGGVEGEVQSLGQGVKGMRIRVAGRGGGCG